MARYIDPFVDFGFKYLFGREESKPFLIDFLNQLLSDEPGFDSIVELEFLNKEASKSDRKVRGVIYDIHCKTSNGKRFAVEMQNQSQPYFFDRIIYYSSKAIVDQGISGKDWKYDYMPVYCVSFMKFVMPGYENDVRIDAAICDLKTGKPFSDKQRFIFIQTPLFTKKREECNSSLDYWLYNIINMSEMDTMAFLEKNSIFESLDNMAAYANLNETDRMNYDADLKAYRDMRGQLEYAEARGSLTAKAEIVKELAKEGMSLEVISRIVKLTVEKVKQILH